jgi:alginate O-acetyltransferase complex protein AlgJ
MAVESLPHGGRSREEIAKAEIAQTVVSPRIARGLVAFFLSAIAIVPSIETLAARASTGSFPAIWSHLTDTPARMSAALQTLSANAAPSLWQQLLAANRAVLAGLSEFESSLEDESILGRALRPWAQVALSGWLGAGNERVYVGRKDDSGTRWLFYRPDLEYLTNRGFLDDDVLRRRRSAVAEWTDLPAPDPRPAIRDFHRQLAALGITLVVMPTPVKPGIHPEKMAGSLHQDRGAQNPSYARFLDWLASEGIAVFDPASMLIEARRSGAQYLATDTHWRPEAMQLAAERLAAFITERAPLAAAGASGYRIDEQEISNQGDTVAMLDLPRHQRLFPQERLVISRVVNGDGSRWQSDRGADVLVLGDSFSNIYSLASMGWGDSAGFVEQLSFALARPVDRIVQNDDGAFATRALLANAGPERLAGKRVVVWQFAARELASGNWKVIR